MDFCSRVLAYMEAKKYKVFRQPGEVNIVYVEGVNSVGLPNGDAFDEWNDRRLVFTFDAQGNVALFNNYTATTEPGKASTFSKQADKLGGVARIPFGQFTVWQVGFHQGDPDHESLVQRRPLTVYADRNKDGKRTGDRMRRASGVNQHSTDDGRPPDKVGGWSAGCLVGLLRNAHREFMRIVKSDPRYLANRKFYFTTTVIDGDDLARKFPPQMPA